MVVQLPAQADQYPSLITGAATLCAFLWRPGLGMEDPSTELDADVQALAERQRGQQQIIHLVLVLFT